MTDTLNSKTVWYFGLEPVKSRYTAQLSLDWIPSAFAGFADKVNFTPINPTTDDLNDQIAVGSVLDATSRGVYALRQCEQFLVEISNGNVNQGDVLYFQDFWQPGIESIFYSLDLHGIEVEMYAMIHAQSVDEYDFTYAMRGWMRGFELGIAARLTGAFVGSTIHREQLRAAGFECPIHVVSLPYGLESTKSLVPDLPHKENQVMFASRLDKEKNPYFLKSVIEDFLASHPTWTWVMTTSGDAFRSTMPGVVEMFEDLASTTPRFNMLTNLSKSSYYYEMARSKILFNSSLQDYVSWTSIEADTFGTKFIAPNFRSFPDFCDPAFMYHPFVVGSAVSLLHDATLHESVNSITRDLASLSDIGRHLVAYIVIHGHATELNIWHEFEYCKTLIQ